MSDVARSQSLSLFVAERYISGLESESVRLEDVRRRQAAARILAGRGVAVRYLGSIFVPEDETCFAFVEARSIDEVRQLECDALIKYQRIVKAQLLDWTSQPAVAGSPSYHKESKSTD